MNAGRLRDFIKVQQRSETQDEYGQPVDTWTDLFADYAEVIRLGGREFFSQARVAADVDTRVTIRYRAGIKAKQRIMFEGTTFDIQSVLPDQKRTQVEIYCKEVN